MDEITTVSPTQAAKVDLAGRAFLHQQGATVCRGRVERLIVTDGRWDLELRDIDYLDRRSGAWERRRAQDSYGGDLNYGGFYLHPDGRFEISGYGMITHVAPPCADPWTAYAWPRLDNYPGGPMTG